MQELLRSNTDAKLHFKKKFTITNILSFLFIIMPIIDSLNGFLIEKQIHISVGQIYRLSLILLLLAIEKGQFSLCNIVTIFMITVIPLLMSTIHIICGTCVSIGSELNYFYQWVFMPVLCVLVLSVIQKGKLGNNFANKCFNSYSWLVPITILLPKLLGVGNSTYANEIGYKGFYYANNGITFLASIIIIYVGYQAMKQPSLSNLLKLFLNATVCVFLGTKSALFSIVISFLICVQLVFVNRKKKEGVRLFGLLGIGLIGILLFANIYMDKLNDIITRFKYMASIYDGSFINILLSGRFEKAIILAKQIKESSDSIFLILIGMGRTDLVSEMDLFDLFFSYGILGLVLTVLPIYTVKKIANNKNIFFKYLFMFSLLYSLIVGHVFTNSLSSMTLVVIISGMVTNIPSKKSTRGNCYENICSISNV